MCGAPLPNVSMPMLDKTGKNLSYYDYGKNSTVVYEIQDFGKKCRLTDELPAMAGKVDFSPDGKKLLFHADVSSGDSSQFSQPIPQYNLGVFLYDRTTKTMVPLHVKADEDSYYPVFLNDNELAFVGSTREAEKKTFHLNVAKLDGRGGCKACVETARARARTALIGNLYARRCAGKTNFEERPGIVNFLTLTAERCRRLLAETKDLAEFTAKNYSKEKVEILGLSSDLATACRGLRSEAPPAAGGGEEAPRGVDAR